LRFSPKLILPEFPLKCNKSIVLGSFSSSLLSRKTPAVLNVVFKKVPFWNPDSVSSIIVPADIVEIINKKKGNE